MPTKNLLGAENMGFFVIMNNFNMERFSYSQVAMVMRWFAMKKLWIGLNSDKLFGKRLIDHQVVHHGY
ncbi:MAG: acyl-CoA dehydrogenase family protein [Acinetobacter parvus]